MVYWLVLFDPLEGYGFWLMNDRLVYIVRPVGRMRLLVDERLIG